MKKISFNAPTTLHKLFTLGIIGKEILIKYGSRIVQLIKRYVGSVRTGNSSRRNSKSSEENLNRNQQFISNSISESEDGDEEES
jgi:hypothetical protein